MSFNKERMTDLFIPIGRPQSSTSSVKTKSSANTASASTVVKSGSSSPTTISSRKSAHHATPQQAGNNSPSSGRYTISAPPCDSRSRHSEYMINSTPGTKRPNTVHIRQHSRNSNVPVSPIEELTKRLSKATDNSSESIKSFSQPPRDRSSSPIKGILATSKSNAGPASSPLYMKSELNSLPTDLPKPKHSRTISLFAKPPTTEETALPSKPEVFPSSLPPPHLLRSHSRSSSHSDRSCPPASFPGDFYDKNTYSRPINKGLQRANSARTRSLASSPRSTSPLKFQVSGSEAPRAMSAMSRPSQIRARSFDIGGLQRLPITPSKTSLSSSISNLTSSPAQIHHYTSCPHTSPPCTRPLNVQPKIDQAFDPPRSTLKGACFDCETLDRRELESSVLECYNPRIFAHKEDLAVVMSHLESRSHVSPSFPAEPLDQLQRLNLGDAQGLSNGKFSPWTGGEQSGHQGSHPNFIADSDEEDVSVELRMQVLEERIMELTRLRDREVREVWQGYTQKWGPGTLGFLKGIDIDQATIRTVETGKSSRMSSESERSQLGRVDGRMKVDWIRDATF